MRSRSGFVDCPTLLLRKLDRFADMLILMVWHKSISTGRIPEMIIADNLELILDGNFLRRLQFRPEWPLTIGTSAGVFK